MPNSISYSDAGVDIDAATRATDKIKELARRTFNQRTLSEIGSFGGMFDGAFPGLAQPVLVASADGVGTKLKIAFATGVHNTVGRDLVNHCVNDILVQGARPLFFLDYIATGKLSPDVVASIVEGVTNGCRENSCVLLGGETAEMPGFYQDGEYDIAGFIVGVVDRARPEVALRTTVPARVIRQCGDAVGHVHVGFVAGACCAQDLWSGVFDWRFYAFTRKRARRATRANARREWRPSTSPTRRIPSWCGRST